MQANLQLSLPEARCSAFLQNFWSTCSAFWTNARPSQAAPPCGAACPKAQSPNGNGIDVQMLPAQGSPASFFVFIVVGNKHLRLFF